MHLATRSCAIKALKKASKLIFYCISEFALRLARRTATRFYRIQFCTESEPPSVNEYFEEKRVCGTASVENQRPGGFVKARDTFISTSSARSVSLGARADFIKSDARENIGMRARRIGISRRASGVRRRFSRSRLAAFPLVTPPPSPARITFSSVPGRFIYPAEEVNCVEINDKFALY